MAMAKLGSEFLLVRLPSKDAGISVSRCELDLYHGRCSLVIVPISA